MVYEGSLKSSQFDTEMALGVSNGSDFSQVRSFKGVTKTVVIISLIVVVK